MILFVCILCGTLCQFYKHFHVHVALELKDVFDICYKYHFMHIAIQETSTTEQKYQDA